MLLASAPRPARARWLGVSALVLSMALAAPSTVGAQDGTVYIGGGSNASDGARGVQGSDNVIVNMDAFDGGRGRATRRDDGGRGAGQPSVEFGEPYRGPAGAILRFPPERPPQSQLVVDPDQLPDRRQAGRDTQQADPTPARKPERAQQQRTASTAPESGAPTSTPSTSTARTSTGPASEPDASQSVEVPDAPSFEGGGAPDGDTRTAATSQPDTAQPESSRAETAQQEPTQPTAARGDAPTELTARPGRKPAPPRDSRTAAASDTAPTDSSRQTAAAPAEPETTQTAADSEPTETAAADTTGATDTGATDTGATDTGATDTGATDTGAADSASPDTSSADTASADATSQAAPEPDAPAQETTSQDGTSQNAPSQNGTSQDGGASGETQTASLPPDGLPQQMRLTFQGGSATLNDAAKQDLDQLAQVLADNPRQRVQLMAFAEGTEDTASQARRLSLSRALAVRTYLIDQGIRSTRMDVRALGATADQGPLDRVDIVPANR